MFQEIALFTKNFGVKADQNQCGLVSMTFLSPFLTEYGKFTETDRDQFLTLICRAIGRSAVSPLLPL